MQCSLRPPDKTGSRGDEVRGKGRILGFVRDRHGVEEPVNFEAEGIERVLRDLPRHVKEQGVVNVEGLAGKWHEASEHSHSKK